MLYKDSFFLLIKRKRKLILILIFVLNMLIDIYSVYYNNQDAILKSKTPGLEIYYSLQYPGTTISFIWFILIVNMNFISTDYIIMNKKNMYLLIHNRVNKKEYYKELFKLNFILSFLFVILVNFIALFIIHVFYKPIHISDLMKYNELYHLNRFISFNNLGCLLATIITSAIGYAIYSNFIFSLCFKVKKRYVYLLTGIVLYTFLFLGGGIIGVLGFRNLHNNIIAYLGNIPVIVNITHLFTYKSVLFNEGNLSNTILLYGNISQYILTILLYTILTLLILKLQLKEE
jgi:hypothetical protein